MINASFLLLALLLDRLLAEPRRYHPLVGFGRLTQGVEAMFYPRHPDTEPAWRMRLRGLCGISLLLLPLTLLAWALARLPLLGNAVAVLLLYLAIGAQSLAQHAEAVASALEQHDLPLARQRVGMIVSRQTDELTESQIARATVESVLENGGDAVFSALFWFLLAGAPGVVLYRLANTLDAMWGYRNQRYQYFGWAAARFDDLLNLIPARLTALTYVLLGNTRVGWRCWMAQASTWYSPNAGPVMAAGAGALNLSLGGAAVYHGKIKARPALGAGREPEMADIRRAVALVRRGMWAWGLLGLLAALCWGGWHA
ncbi:MULTISPECIES: adenosylcobinamide-phosphate synthase CbiB [unclassified Paludibacterium]|uniref:adenosylcobinamide-phosphate synthase CbiB n=1 Tax=unclassified Paludibacterium TaxID=2618429 RepID=UPI001C041D2D|nr:adenosylcobinamide-phosphate synthase CbiB [Paludibacterium sp. B53371]BEV70991.1 adenosylcobinamide-phosphate synthase CbiB [Paludibacterium sp. THUN1379]